MSAGIVAQLVDEDVENDEECALAKALDKDGDAESSLSWVAAKFCANFAAGFLQLNATSLNPANGANDVYAFRPPLSPRDGLRGLSRNSNPSTDSLRRCLATSFTRRTVFNLGASHLDTILMKLIHDNPFAVDQRDQHPVYLKGMP